MVQNDLIGLLKKYAATFYPVVAYRPATDKLLAMDFTEANKDITVALATDLNLFCNYVEHSLRDADCKYGIGGYNELRTLYARSEHFDTKGEPRRLHLGLDIWGPAGTKVSAFMGGMVHSFAYNRNYGDYGATIILSHQLDAIPFYTLYGHLSLQDIDGISEGTYVVRGQTIGHFGPPSENGQWPPHLHFQIIKEMGVYRGDYPGVCRASEKEHYLLNSPDPDLILQLNRYLPK